MTAQAAGRADHDFPSTHSNERNQSTQTFSLGTRKLDINVEERLTGRHYRCVSLVAEAGEVFFVLMRAGRFGYTTVAYDDFIEHYTRID